MEIKTVKATVSGVDYRTGPKGQFLVANFTYEDNGKEHTLKGKAVFDRVDAVTVEQSNKDKFPLTVVIEKTDPDSAGKFFYNIKSVKKFIGGEVLPVPSPIPVQTHVDAPQATNKPLKERIEPQERGMWYKEIGELIRSGKFSPGNPSHTALQVLYFERMYEVMGVNTK